MKLPVMSLMVPIRNGPTKPARLPMELIAAIPAAAVAAGSISVAVAQNGPFTA